VRPQAWGCRLRTRPCSSSSHPLFILFILCSSSARCVHPVFILRNEVEIGFMHLLCVDPLLIRVHPQSLFILCSPCVHPVLMLCIHTMWASNEATRSRSSAHPVFPMYVLCSSSAHPLLILCSSSAHPLLILCSSCVHP
jgi:hypothetical protein